MFLSGIYIYPIKSLGGIRLDYALAEPRGLQHDRRWMLVNEQGHFLTQRKYPHMALLQVQLEPNSLLIMHRQRPQQQPLHISLEKPGTEPLEVTIWDDRCLALPVSPEADAWFTDALGINCRLVYMPDTTHRPVDPDYARHNEEVSFADGYPFLLIGQASLDDLNSRLAEPVPMNRFRPNFVFSGGQPYEEETWHHFRIGGSTFAGVKPCARCVVTTINQQTAEKAAEPLRTLATYRSKGNKVLFGQNVLPVRVGEIQVGDAVEVTDWLDQ